MPPYQRPTRTWFYPRLCMVAALLAVGSNGAVARAGAAAIVNGVTITTDDVDRALKRTSASRKDLTKNERRVLRDHALRILIDDHLINKYLDKRKIDVDDAAVDKHIADLRRREEKNGRTLEALLAEADIDKATMRREVRNLLRWLLFVKGQSSDEALRKFFDANPHAFDGTTVRASHILVAVEPTASAEEKKKARGRAEQIRERLIAGSSFAELARKHSDCPSREVDGDLDYFPRKGVMSEPFAAAAFALPSGRVSGVVETELGYHLIMTTDRKPGVAVEYEDVIDHVKAQFADDLRQAIVARLRQTAEIKILEPPP